MNLYPALRARMGNWDYYICKMKMRELASEVRFASEVYDDRTLDEAIQRVLNEGRVKREIVSFLKRRPDRFFASIVVASLGGNPSFYPVRITDDPQFAIFADQGLDQSFGVLTFNGEQNYYALDGQHRLKAIQTLLDRNEESDPPEGFSEEEISVLMIVRQEKADAAFLQSYRRLFSSLNRYAKKTDPDTDIIMDEDDAFAILTRRLITDHDFFKWSGRQMSSPKVKMKGKNLNSSDPHFTSLQTLYRMNETLLRTAARDVGWGPDSISLSEFKRFRPDEDYMDDLYVELETYWSGLLLVLPELYSEPHKMRSHDADVDEQGELTDNLLFWPIGQELLAEVSRRVLNYNLDNARNLDSASVASALQGMGTLEWRLHRPPWRYFLLTTDAKGVRWRMRSEDRTESLRVARRILDWILGIDDLRSEDIEELKLDWQTRLVPAQTGSSEDAMWEEIVERRRAI